MTELLSAKDLRGCLRPLLAAALRLPGCDCAGIPLVDEHLAALGEAAIGALRAREAERQSRLTGETANEIPNQRGARPAADAADCGGDLTEGNQVERIRREWDATLERRVAERTLELHRSEARCQQLAEAAFEGIVISKSGVIVDGNSQLVKLLGYDLTEIVGRRLSDFVVAALRPNVEERVRTDDASTTEICCLRKDGTTFPAEVRIRILKEDGHTVRVTALRDLTEEHATAAKIRAQRAELEATRRLALVSEISAGIIHQLTQPLSSVAVNLMLATTKQQSCRCQTCAAEGPLAEAEKDVTRMREIIAHLRTLDNPADSPRVDMDLNAVIVGTTPLLQPGAESLRIALGVELAENLPPVAMDWVQMSQVVINLTRNAFDACADCPPERRVVTIRTRSLAGGGLEMSVCDTGSGIAPDALERLFCPLFTTKANGLGIGLRLSQTIVQAHGGTLAGENNHDGRGATFRVVLPLENPRYTKE